FADDAQHLAAPQVVGDTVDRADLLAFAEEGDAQVFDFEEPISLPVLVDTGRRLPVNHVHVHTPRSLSGLLTANLQSPWISRRSVRCCVRLPPRVACGVPATSRAPCAGRAR